MARLDGKNLAFTLLEMLVAMVLMSVLAASLYASLRIGFKARDSAWAAVRPTRAAGLAIDLVGDDIESALPPTGTLAGIFLGQDGQGGTDRDADTLEFYSSAHQPRESQRECDVRKIELALETLPDQAGLVLVRRIATNLLSPKTVEPTEETLCRGVLTFNVRYFDGSEWQDSWDSSTQGNVLPLAVEVTLELEPRTGEDRAANGYRLSRVFLPPCSTPAADEGTQVIRPASW